MLVYLNGECVSSAEARVPAEDRGLLHGYGFFETFRTSGGKPHHWSFHRRRLARACATAALPLPSTFLANDEAKLATTIQHLLRSHGRADAVFRYTVTAGSTPSPVAGANGTPTELLTLRALPPIPPREGIALRVLQLARDSGEWVPRPKSLNYLNALLGAQELQRRSSEPFEDALFLTRDGGFVVETARQNIAWIADGRLCYPDYSLGAVTGTCLEWALALGCPVKACRATLDEFAAAEAILTVNSVRGITPVHTVWDAQDRTTLCALRSAAHPMVISLRQQWDEALAGTARD